MRFSGVERRRIREIESELARLDLARPRALESIMPAIEELVGADKHVAYTLRLAGGRAEPDLMVGDNVTHTAARNETARLMREQPLSWTAYNVHCPEPEQRNRAIDVAREKGWDTVYALPYYQQVAVPNGLAHHDQLRVLVCEDQTLLAFVGVWRHGAVFSDRERDLLQALVPALHRRLTLERDLLEARELRSGFDAALEAIAGEAFVLDRRGRICEANAAGRAHLAREPSLREILHAVLAGQLAGYSVTRLEHGGALLVGRGTEARELRVQLASRERKLTPRQTEVLRELACGKSNKEIASALGCSPETVEVHLRALCQKFGSESRAGILARLLEL